MRRRGRRLSWIGAWVGSLLAGSGVPALECERGTVPDPRGTNLGSEDDCNGNLNPDACDVAAVNFGFVPRGKAGPGVFLLAAGGDFDSDGDLDLVGETSGPVRSISVLLNRGDGTFFEPVPTPLAPHGYLDDFAVADLDGDEDLDLVGADQNLNTLAIFKNDGQGGFSAGTSLQGVDAPHRVKALDLDGNGRADLAVTMGWPRGIFFWNVADAVFLPIASITGMESLILEAAADFDADGDVDLIVTTPGSAILYRNDGQFVFVAAGTLPFTSWAQSSIAGDLDRDGDMDLALSPTSSNELLVFLNDGRGSFAPGASLKAGQNLSLASGDIDGDGLEDLVAASNDQLDFYLNRGHGSFSARSMLPPGLQRAYETSIVPGDFDADGDIDLALATSNAEFVSLLENHPVAVSLDCNANDIPDECEPGIRTPACEDCDANGIPDPREIEDGTQADVDRNGIPDACEAGVEFRMRFHGPGRVSGSAGTLTRFGQTVQIQTLGIEAGQPGVQGWSFIATAEGGKLVAATTAGTAAAPAPEGYWVQGYQRTGLIVGPECQGVASAVALNVTGLDVTLDPAVGPLDILDLTVEAEVPSEGRGVCRLEITECDGRFQRFPEQGAGGDHDVESPLITYQGFSYSPRVLPRTVQLVPARFLRGDVNADRRVDISDAIRAFMFLFLGASEPPCLDGADANDDGAVDMTDGIHILNDFFREGTAIPDPGPFECGPDPTPDGVTCNGSVPCP